LTRCDLEAEHLTRCGIQQSRRNKNESNEKKSNDVDGWIAGVAGLDRLYGGHLGRATSGGDSYSYRPFYVRQV
jgi:hypothetical protein